MKSGCLAKLRSVQTLAGLLVGFWLLFSVCHPVAAQQANRLNILWITCEDIGPHLGCYGDSYSITPNLDRLASRGVRYTNAYANAPVCSAARSCLITGVYATALGTQPQRSHVKLPDEITCFSQYLRESGYYCVNNAEEDYNFVAPPGSWNESSASAHWRNRKPGQPFFQMFTFDGTHSSMMGRSAQDHAMHIAALQQAEIHDPAAVPVKPYYVDSPLLREAIAQYYDNITLMDRWAGDLLRQLEEDGLAEDTIVLFFADQGRGMPRSKGTLYESGLQIPRILCVPQKLRHFAPAPAGTAVDESVSVVDFAPTMMHVSGLRPRPYMQGRIFLGDDSSPRRKYVYGAADCARGWSDLSRSVRDQRYKYIRHYLSYRPYMPDGSYLALMSYLREMVDLTKQGLASDSVAKFATRNGKPVEELYDLQTDPDVLNNLASSVKHADVLRILRQQLDDWMIESRDIRLMPECERALRQPGKTPHELAGADEIVYPRNKKSWRRSSWPNKA